MVELSGKSDPFQHSFPNAVFYIPALIVVSAVGECAKKHSIGYSNLMACCRSERILSMEGNPHTSCMRAAVLQSALAATSASSPVLTALLIILYPMWRFVIESNFIISMFITRSLGSY